MKTQLILVEGLPGSGKTTFAKKIEGWCRGRGVEVKLYTEGQVHPADLAWSARIPMAQYEKVLEQYASLREDIEKNTVVEGEFAITAYTQVRTSQIDYYEEMAAFEVYNGRVSDDVFLNVHYDRWSEFGRAAKAGKGLHIFECAFMQNHVEELLFWRNADKEAVVRHLDGLLDLREGKVSIIVSIIKLA